MSENNKDSSHRHEFDGILEQDNDLPRWWVYLFIVTIVFSVCYMAWYHWPIGAGKSQEEEYQAALAANKQQLEAHQGQQPAFDFAVAVKDQATIDKGKTVFAEMCVACHGNAGQGGVGPNLTDDHWIHDPTYANLEKFVIEGNVEKGMPAWGEILGRDKIRAVVSFIGTIQGTNPPGAKAAQGNPGKLK